MDGGIILSRISFVLAIYLLLPSRRLPVTARISLLAGVIVLAMVPFQGLPLAASVGWLTDDLAITTVAWLGWSSIARIRGVTALTHRQHWHLALCFGFLALLLYPATLGLSIFDPYRLGYAPRLLLLLVFAIGVALWLLRSYLGAALLTIAVAAFVLNIKPSNNCWDYLVDPLLGLYCLGFIIWQTCRWKINRSPAVKHPEGSSGACAPKWFLRS